MIIYVTGLPCVGKTHCMKKLREKFVIRVQKQFAILSYEYYPIQNVVLLGDYNLSSDYIGTDAYDLRAIEYLPLFVRDIKDIHTNNPIILCEGLIFSKLHILNRIKRYDRNILIVHLRTYDNMIKERMELRDSYITPNWIAKCTKEIELITHHFNTIEFWNVSKNDPKQFSLLMYELMEAMKYANEIESINSP